MRVALALLATLLAPVVAACTLGAPSHAEVRLAPLDARGDEAPFVVHVALPALGDDCALRNPFAVNGTVVAWAEQGAGSTLWDLRATVPGRREPATFRGIADGEVDAVGLSGEVAYWAGGGGAGRVDLRTGERAAIDLGANVTVARRISGAYAAVISADALDAPQEARRLVVVDLASGRPVFGPASASELDVSQLGALRAFEPPWLALDAHLLNVDDGTRRAFAEPGLVAIDGAQAFVHEDGALWSIGLPDGARTMRLRAEARPIDVQEGRALFAKLAPGAPPRATTLAFAHPERWRSAHEWLDEAIERSGLAPDLVVGDGALLGLNVELVDDGTARVELTVRPPGGGGTPLEHRNATFRGAHGDGAFLVPPEAPSSVATLSPDGLLLTLVGPPEGLAPPGDPFEAARAFAARLGLPEGEWTRGPPGRVPLVGTAERSLVELDCSGCAVLVRGDPSRRFDAAVAYVRHDATLVAFQTTPWIDLPNSTLLSDAELRARLRDALRLQGYEPETAAEESRRLVLTRDEPRLAVVWRASLEYAPEQPWTRLRVEQDASDGTLVGGVRDLELDPDALPTSTTPTAPTTTSATTPGSRPAPTAATLIVLGAVAVAALGRPRPP